MRRPIRPGLRHNVGVSHHLSSERIVGPEREELLVKVRHTLGDLQAALIRIHAGPDDEDALRESVRQLDELFSLVVVGEFNAGKSAFINALLGDQTLKEGATPTTSRIQILKYGRNPDLFSLDDSIDVVSAPLPLLKDIRLIDTPGTNAIQRQHEALTQHFVPRADLILFVSSADRPFTESERVFLERIREWGKKVVVAVNKLDILENDEDRDSIRNFVTDNARTLLGATPEVFLVSSRLAQQAKRESDEAKLAASGFNELEDYIFSTLNEEERFRLKLLNPLGVGLRLLDKYTELIQERLRILEADIAAVEEVGAELKVYEQDMIRGFELRFSDVDLILHQFEARGHDFFDEMVRAGRVFDLINKSKVKSEFERLVAADVARRVEDKVNALIDWLITCDLQQWQAIRDHFEQRKSVHAERIVGQISGGFEYDRARLLETVGKEAQDTLASYDQAKEGSRMAESVQTAVAGAALLEVGAVGLGTIITIAATSSAADVTGIAAAGVMATMGLFVLPHRRRRAKDELRRKIAALRQQLKSALYAQFEKEIRRNLEKMQETVAPYTRFVRGERENLLEKKRELESLRQKAYAVKSRLAGREA